MKTILTATVCFFCCCFLSVTSCKRGEDEQLPQPSNCEAVQPLVFSQGTGKLALPDAFTPNGDGRNDLFLPIFDGLEGKDYSLRILLAGNVIFTSNSLTAGWDGKTSTGEACAPGRYAVNIRFKTLDGTVKDTCNYVTLLAAKPNSNCILTYGRTYHFGDQIDPASPERGFGRVTAEALCP